MNARRLVMAWLKSDTCILTTTGSFATGILCGAYEAITEDRVSAIPRGAAYGLLVGVTSPVSLPFLLPYSVARVVKHARGDT